jgi:arylsulfatase A-like enzyme
VGLLLANGLFLLLVTALKATLIVCKSTAGVAESIGYLLPEVTAGCLLVAALSVLPLGNGRAAYVVKSTVLCVAALLAALSFALQWVSGSTLDWPLVGFAVMRIDELWPVIASELSLARACLLAAPVLVVLLPPLLTRRIASPAPRELGGAAVLTAAVAWGASLALIPAVPTDAGLATSSLRPFLPLGAWRPRERQVLADERTLLPDPESLRAAWQRRPSTAPTPSFLFILMESVRASATTPYNPPLPSTPFLAELARKSLVFERAYCLVPHTSKSLLAAFCGYPPELGTPVNEAGRLPAPALPALLGRIGYRSAFFEPATQHFEDRALLVRSLGFQDYYSAERIGEGYQRHYFGFEDRSLVRPLLDWLKKDRTRPFCAGLINLTTHHDYRVPEGFLTRRFDVAELPPNAEEFQRYLNTLRYFDDTLREIFAQLEAAGLLDDTVVFLVGDHGEAFGEHGRSMHNDVPYEEALRIPLIVHGPEELLGPPRRVGGLRQIIDLFPTVEQLVGVRSAQQYLLLGTSLLGAVAPNRLLFAASFYGGSYARIAGDDKWIWFPQFERFEHYHLALDPAERWNLVSASRPAERAAFLADVRGHQAVVNAWYLAADGAEAARIRRTTLPPMQHSLDAVLGGRLRCVGVNARTTVQRREHIDVDLAFEVLQEPPDELALCLEARQAGRLRPVIAVRDLNRLPVRDWRKGDRILIPQTLLLNEDGPGRVTLELRVENASRDGPGEDRLVLVEIEVR